MVAVAELLVGLESIPPPPDTVAVLEIFPDVEGLTFTVIVMVALPFLAMLPRLHVMVVVPLQLP